MCLVIWWCYANYESDENRRLNSRKRQGRSRGGLRLEKRDNEMGLQAEGHPRAAAYES